MKNDINPLVYKKLLRLNVELEGLLRVMAERHSEEARQAFAEKFAEYSSLASEIMAAPVEKVPEKIVEQELVEEKANPMLEVKLQEAEEPQIEPEIPATAQVVEHEVKIKLDEMLSRNESADLRRAFTINDRFRFKRELFGGDNEAFNAAIEHLMQLGSYAEAEDYIYGQLGIDAEKEEAVDFMAVVGRHFANDL